MDILKTVLISSVKSYEPKIKPTWRVIRTPHVTDVRRVNQNDFAKSADCELMRKIEIIKFKYGVYHGELKVLEGTKEKEITGYGRLTLSKGRTILEGNFVDGRLDGFGVIILIHFNHEFDEACGSSYIGNFKLGKRDGFGKMRYCDGSSYTGHYRKGKRHGEGLLIHANGDSHIGRFKDGRIEGLGEKIFNDGACYLEILTILGIPGNS